MADATNESTTSPLTQHDLSKGASRVSSAVPTAALTQTTTELTASARGTRPKSAIATLPSQSQQHSAHSDAPQKTSPRPPLVQSKGVLEVLDDLLVKSVGTNNNPRPRSNTSRSSTTSILSDTEAQAIRAQQTARRSTVSHDLAGWSYCHLNHRLRIECPSQRFVVVFFGTFAEFHICSSD
jgi:hypothetical protein